MLHDLTLPREDRIHSMWESTQNYIVFKHCWHTCIRRLQASSF